MRTVSVTAWIMANKTAQLLGVVVGVHGLCLSCWITASVWASRVIISRLLYPLTFFSLRQVGGREPGSSLDVTLPLIPDEDREINQHMYAV